MKKTQEERVIECLREYGQVNNFWAFHNYILRLGAIICQLKKKGWEFLSYFGEGANAKNYYYEVIKDPDRKTTLF